MNLTKKFELTNEHIEFCGRKLFRIRALIDFSCVKAGDLGGYIEKDVNLSQSGNAWVSGNARVSGDAWVSGNAWVFGDSDYACVKGFGTEHRNTTFFREKDGGAKVRCGCFFGTIAEFRAQVRNKRKGKIAKEYLMIADLMEYHFAKDVEEDE